MLWHPLFTFTNPLPPQPLAAEGAGGYGGFNEPVIELPDLANEDEEAELAHLAALVIRMYL
jgi:hypothetical protein